MTKKYIYWNINNNNNLSNNVDDSYVIFKSNEYDKTNEQINKEFGIDKYLKFKNLIIDNINNSIITNLIYNTIKIKKSKKVYIFNTVIEYLESSGYNIKLFSEPNFKGYNKIIKSDDKFQETFTNKYRSAIISIEQDNTFFIIA